MSVVLGDGCVRPSHRRGSGASPRGINIPGLRARKGANGDAAACVGYDAMARMQRGRVGRGTPFEMHTPKREQRGGRCCDDVK